MMTVTITITITITIMITITITITTVIMTMIVIIIMVIIIIVNNSNNNNQIYSPNNEKWNTRVIQTEGIDLLAKGKIYRSLDEDSEGYKYLVISR